MKTRLKSRIQATASDQLKFGLIIVLIAGIIALLTSCSDDPEPDRFIGHWKYEHSTDPKIDVEFDIKASGDSYIIENIEVDDTLTWDYFVIGEATLGQRIENFGVSNVNQVGADLSRMRAISFINCRLDGGVIKVDSVGYQVGHANDPVIITNQTIEK